MSPPEGPQDDPLRSAAPTHPRVAGPPTTTASGRSRGRAIHDDERLELEMRLLKVAHDSLATDPARALRLAKLGEQEFAGSTFTQERHYVWIVALARLKRLDEARRRARSYLKAYPAGPYSDRVRRALKPE